MKSNELPVTGYIQVKARKPTVRDVVKEINAQAKGLMGSLIFKLFSSRNEVKLIATESEERWEALISP